MTDLETAHNPINIAMIDHVVLRAHDAPRLIAFYCDVLGCRLEKVQDRIGLWQLRAGASLIDIVSVDGTLGQRFDAPRRDAPNMDHFCLQVEPWDADAILAHLARHGLSGLEVVTRYGSLGEGPSIYLEDPEGNAVELKGPSFA